MILITFRSNVDPLKKNNISKSVILSGENLIVPFIFQM